MESQELDILILRYLNGDMTAEEFTAFESRMSSDDALKQSVEEYAAIEFGIKDFAKKEMKTELLAAQSAVMAAKGLENYKPSLNGGGGFNVFSFVAKLLVIGGIVSAALIYFDKMPIKHELIEKVNDKMHSFDTLFEVKYDTVWTTIPAGKLKTGDTVYIKTQEEMDAFEESIETNSYEE